MISLFKNAFAKVPESEIPITEYFDNIKDLYWQDPVLDYKTGKREKATLPAVSVSGTFEKRKKDGLIKHSGVLNIDIDAKENPDTDLLGRRDELAADEYTYGMHISVSGGGLSLYVKINPSKHYESFIALEKYYANTYDIIIDKQTKDITRLRFVSCDPELFFNSKAKKWNSYIEKEKRPPRKYSSFVASGEDFIFVMQQVISKGINITEDYHDWITIGFAFASEFGADGRDHFHSISSISGKYDEKKCNKKYDSFLRSKRAGVSISSFYWMAQRAGCDIKTHKTQTIENVGKLRLKQVGKSGGAASKEQAMVAAKEYLQTVEEINSDDIDEVLEQVKELSSSELSEKSDTETQINNIIQIINQHGIFYNLITGKIETEKEALTDNDINSVFIDVLQVDEKIKRQLFDTVLYSNRIKRINPFLKFIEDNKHIKGDGSIQKLIDTINDRMFINNERFEDFKDVFVSRWLISIISSIFGTYSLLILVLTGKQMTKKTEFFRGLLPEELRRYYAESKLDAGKDDEILMTQKIIIIDDEFGGKSKQEAKKLKDLSSKQVFSIRRPYGRTSEDIQRIAVLGGTSNEDDILNDPTGNRRIIPLKIESIDMDAYAKIDKTELFMEMYHYWKKNGDSWMLDAEQVELLNQATIQHEQVVAEEELIKQYYEPCEDYRYEITTTQIKVYLERKTNQNLNLYKLGQNLKKLGHSQKVKKINGISGRVWDIQEIKVNGKEPF